jgi:protein gp37
MNRSSIEYLTHSWNFFTGCRNQENGVCNLPCWVRAMAKRFHSSFEPEFNPAVFSTSMPKKPARIGACFTGDLFGDWVNPEMPINMLGASDILLRDSVFKRLNLHKQHEFLFLTKCPWNLLKWGKFPDNALVGASCTDERTYAFRLYHLIGAEANWKWLSLEPLLGRIDPMLLQNTLPAIQWIVIGAQSHPNVMPKIEWVREIVEAADKAGIPVWLKNNLHPLMKYKSLSESSFAYKNNVYRQELPV